MNLIVAISLFAAVFTAANSAPTTSDAIDFNWWRHAVFYQIYPRSFKDSDNDGIGDLQGIIEKLPHFTDAGISAIWLSPIYKSPQVDQGYDISDYRQVDLSYGTMEDIQELIETAHNLGIKVILDFVPNHTSNQSQWFIDSENGVEEFKDFYVWMDPKFDENGNRKPPNNWISIFKYSAWEWSEKRQQYYLHQFASAQPDLNYDNPNVVQAMKDVITFWLDQGVDGFRIDAVPYLIETNYTSDEPLSGLFNYTENDYKYLNHTLTSDLPSTYEIIYEWRDLVDDYTLKHGGFQRVLMTEAYTTVDKTMLYYGMSDGSRLGAHFTFNFNLISDLNINSTANDVVNAIEKWLNAIPEIYTSNWVLGNHDNRRVATRLGPQNVDGYNMLMAILPGVGVTYNGEEIGQEDGKVTYEEGQDPSARDPAIFEQVTRDFERTPYQWDNSTNAGFNEGAKPWLPVSEKYLQTNLQSQINVTSHYKVYQQLMLLRKYDILINGDVFVMALSKSVLLISRTLEDTSINLLFNIGSHREIVDVEQFISKNNHVLLCNVNSTHQLLRSINPRYVTLEAHESIIVFDM